MAVNLSARTLLDRGFAEEVRGAAAPTGGCRRDLLDARDHRERRSWPTRSARGELLGRAVARSASRSSIDDFGTGYSSLASLRSLPVARAQDRPLVRHAHARPAANDAFIVRSVIDARRTTLGLRVVAEGVEDEATLQALRELGCDVAQGFHLGAPAPGDVLGALLTSLPAGGVARPVRVRTARPAVG